MQAVSKKRFFMIAIASASVFATGMHPAIGGNALPSGQAHASPLASRQDAPNQESASPLHDWVAVDANILNALRGGFITDGGLQVSIGIERLVSINGELQTATRFEFQNGGAAGGTLTLPANATQLVQNGTGNLFSPGQLAQANNATFIQNSLNDQTIRSITVINATTNSLEMLRSAGLQSTLRDALIDSAATR